MSHFAKVEDGIVTAVYVAEQDWVDAQVDSDKYVQTSYNTKGGKHCFPDSYEEDSGTPLRKNYAGVGHIYDSARDAFYIPQPYPSWTLNDDTCMWEPPVDYPASAAADDKYYEWDEDTTAWVEITE
jgi:hypothetical protein